MARVPGCIRFGKKKNELVHIVVYELYDKQAQ